MVSASCLQEVLVSSCKQYPAMLLLLHVVNICSTVIYTLIYRTQLNCTHNNHLRYGIIKYDCKSSRRGLL